MYDFFICSAMLIIAAGSIIFAAALSWDKMVNWMYGTLGEGP